MMFMINFNSYKNYSIINLYDKITIIFFCIFQNVYYLLSRLNLFKFINTKWSLFIYILIKDGERLNFFQWLKEKGILDFQEYALGVF